MPSRRTHRKSRWGCTACKRRRVKCDELRPSCSNCTKRQTECVYDSAANSIFLAHHDHSQGNGTAHDTGTEENIRWTLPERFHPAGPTTDAILPLNLTDLELLLHWSNSTYQTFARTEEAIRIWQYLVPQEALQQPFLMHGILALSAIHLSRDKSDDLKMTYVRAAAAHQDQALSVFRELLHNINASTAKAAFAFSGIIVIYSFAFPHTLASENPWTPIDDLCQVLVFSRGAHRILREASDFLRESIFTPLLRWDETKTALSHDTVTAFNRLRSTGDYLAADGQQYEAPVYQKTIDSIQDALAEASCQPLSASAATRTAIRLPAQYIDLLREHRPFALVLLGYYCTILHRLRHNWCLEGWSVRVCRALWRLLDDEGRELMRWAKEDICGPSI